jgi:hypothetical protein
MSIHISFIGIVLLLSVGLFVAVGLMKLIAATGNAMLGRTPGTDGVGSFLAAMVKLMVVCGILLIVVGAVFVSRSRIAVSTDVAGRGAVHDISVEVHDGALEITRELRHGLQELEQAREEVRDAFQNSGRIPLGTESDSDASDTDSDDAVVSPVKSTDSQPAEAEDEEDEEGSNDAGQLPAEQPEDGDTGESVTVIAEADTSGRPRIEASKDNDDATSASENVADASSAAQAGNVVVFQLSDESLRRLLGTKGIALLDEIRDKLPEELRDSYALIPLTATVSTTAPAAVRRLASADGFQSVVTTVASMIPDATIAATDSQSEAQDPVAESDVSVRQSLTLEKSPQWLTTRAARQFLVETEFAPQTDEPPSTDDPSLTDQLRLAINNALVEYVRDAVLEDDDDYSRNWFRLVDLRLSQDALADCIIDQHEVVEVLNTKVGPQVMRKTVALVEFPAEIQQAALREIRVATQRQRTSILGMAVGIFWMGLVLATAGFRIGRRKSRLARYVAAPLFLLTATGLGAGAVSLVGATTAGEFVSTPFDGMEEVVLHNSHSRR